jgi:hypothetical protein
MFHRVVVDVIAVLLKILFISDCVLLEPALPNAALLAMASRV